MTGFGFAQKGGVRVDVRSLNSKHREIHFHMPAVLNIYEMKMRELLRDRFVRGRFDVAISFTENSGRTFNVDMEALESINRTLQELNSRLGYESTIDLDSLLVFREYFIKKEEDIREEELLEAFILSLSALQEMRNREGSLLRHSMIDSIGALSRAVEEIRELSQALSERCRDKIMRRLNQLIDTSSIEEARLCQEVAFIAQRADISEELERLNSHIHQFLTSLEQETTGKRLDFIVQEMFRETNTISQKSEDIKIINLTISMKTEIERLKEQAQNIQ